MLCAKIWAGMSAIVICVAANGCGGITDQMWTEADRTSLPYSSVDLNATGPGPESPTLLVEYKSSDRTRRLSVPLDQDGWPLPPFDCGHAKVTRDSWALAGITEKQRLQMFQAAAVPRVYWDTNARGGNAPDSLVLSDPAICAMVVAYRYTPHRGLCEVRFEEMRDQPNQPDLRLAVIPSDLPVDLKKRCQLRNRALLLTPVTVLGDGLEVAVFVPVLIVLSPIVVPMILTLHRPSGSQTPVEPSGSIGPPATEPKTVSRHGVDYVQAAIRSPAQP